MREPITVVDVLAAGPPWFGLAGASGIRRVVTGWGGGDDEVHLSLQHQWPGRKWCSVDTSVGRPIREREREFDLLPRWFSTRVIGAEIKPHDYPLRFEVNRFEASIPVGGVATPFVVIGDELSWVARGVVGDRQIGIQSFGVDVEGMELVAVDPESDYEMPREY